MKLTELESRSNYGTVRGILNGSMFFSMAVFFLIPLILLATEGKDIKAFFFWIGVPLSYLAHKSALVLFDISDGILLLYDNVGTRSESIKEIKKLEKVENPSEAETTPSEPSDELNWDLEDESGSIPFCPKCNEQGKVWGPDVEGIYHCSNCEQYFKHPDSTKES